MRDLASVELHFTKHSSVIAEKTSRTGGLRCTVSLYKDTRVPDASCRRWPRVLRTARVVRSIWDRRFHPSLNTS